MNAEKKRLDVALVEAGLLPSREAARRLILAGQVRVDGRIVDKPGTKVAPDSHLEVVGPTNPYVSRGGLKLAAALAAFPVQVAGAVALDVGASTGGFTDCLLQHGARLVYAVDVGWGQLAWKLRQDPRVRVLERTNIRYLKPEALGGERPTLATIDVSFISLRLVLPAVYGLVLPGSAVIPLIKPQFEAGRGQVGKKGVVRDPQVHREVLLKVGDFARESGFLLRGLIASPILGPEGNREFLAWFETVSPAAESPEGGLTREEWCELTERVVGEGGE
ncbi:MAG: TlyA family RNA methyltransferase [Limnochordales bacterium]|nr:TlyA family RNA methyltransferase [Limnochordales bacterium]